MQPSITHRTWLAYQKEIRRIRNAMRRKRRSTTRKLRKRIKMARQAQRRARRRGYADVIDIRTGKVKRLTGLAAKVVWQCYDDALKARLSTGHAPHNGAL